ncbi:hypothetical protein [Streptomyces achromogenes]|uniref:hypothetical protein n=1 Tax=Streptomyces achromogenes TaxID=67255 RepID=UPI00367A8463
MIELTLDRVKELLNEAVAEKGADYVYTTPDGKQGTPEYQPTCLYVHGDKPGCIVGHALHRAGVSLSLLLEEEQDDASSVLRSLAQLGVLSYTDGVSQLLYEAQQRQDHGTSWGEAVQQALAELEG